MATVNIALTSASNQGSSGLNSVMPVADGTTALSEVITSSGTSQQSTVAIVPSDPQKAKRLFWVITASGSNVWVTFGQNPVASPGTTWLIVDGTTRDFGARPGDKAAVITG